MATTSILTANGWRELWPVSTPSREILQPNALGAPYAVTWCAIYAYSGLSEAAQQLRALFLRLASATQADVRSDEAARFAVEGAYLEAAE